MSKFAKLIKKVAAGEFSELNHRAREQMIVRSERRHHKRGDDLFSEAALRNIFTEEFFSRHTSGGAFAFAGAVKDHEYPFFPGFAYASEFPNWLRSDGRILEQEILNRAEHVCSDRFTIFSLGSVSYGSPPRWNYDPVNQKQAPAGFYADLKFLDQVTVGDSKLIWELSRFQFVFDLGQAYLLTGNEKYPRKFFELICDWSDSHPDYEGIAYCSALEFAFRVHSLIWGLDFFRNSPELTNSVARAIYRLLHLSGTFLENHLSRYFAPNTHLLGEAWGLALLGLLFPEFSRADSWWNMGMEIIIAECRNQFNDSGFHAELSTAYHAYALEFLTILRLLADARNRRTDSDLLVTILEAHLQLEYLQRPDGLWPHIGDEDGGRVLFLSRTPSHDFRPLLEVCDALIAHRSRVGIVATYPETFFLVGPSTRSSRIEQGEKPTVHMKDTDYCVLRGEGGQYLLFQAGKFGHLECPHSHADMLQVDFSVGDDNFIVDPGTFVYSGDIKRRNQYRSGENHNGPFVEDFYLSSDPFAWREQIDCEVTELAIDRPIQKCAGLYRLAGKQGSTTVGRRVEHIGQGLWQITDDIELLGHSSVRWRFTSPYRVEEREGQYTIRGESATLLFVPVAITGKLDTAVAESRYSRDYMQEDPASAIVATASGSERIVVVWLLVVEEKGDEHRLTVERKADELIVVNSAGHKYQLEIKQVNR